MTDVLGGVLSRPGIDDMFEMLCNRRRRMILLLVNAGTVETKNDVMVRGSSEPHESEIALVHNHLPKLEETGYIEWDRDTDEISKGPRFEEIEPLLELIENHADELPPDWP
jgi:hypothetical protein